MRRTLLLPSLLLLSISAPARSQLTLPVEFEGRVVAVMSGDTVRVQRDTAEIQLRLYGIDAPEVGQPYNQLARKALSDHVLKKKVTVRVFEKASDTRMSGEVLLDEPDREGVKQSLNAQMLRDGLAWWYHQHGSSDRRLAAAETEARAARRGLWQDEFPLPPWAFRAADPEMPAQHDSNGSDPARSRSKPDLPEKQTQPRWVFVTRSGGKYHVVNCRHLKNASAISLAVAKARRLTPCSVCRP
jgi:endonuclease YncB( thermonuclease family)